MTAADTGMAEAFLCDGVRTPIGRYGGALASVRADDLAAHPIRALTRLHPKLDWAAVDEVILGCANQAGEDNRNVARMALLLAGLPASVPLKDPIVSGRVVERTAQGDRPIPGASVIVDFADYDTIPGPAPFITTLTDSQGHYVVCGTAIGTIRVRATGYDGDARGIDLSRPTAHDFALVRR